MTCDALRPPVRGVGRVCETLLQGLARQGDEVVPLDWRDNAHAAALAGRPCAIAPHVPGPFATARWHAALLARLPAVPHDVVLGTAGFPHVRGRHPRLAVLVHDLHMLEPGFYQPGKRLWFRAFLGAGLRKAALRICVSAHTKRELERRFPDLDPGQNVVVHNAVAAQFVSPASRSSGDGEHFLFVGQLERRKNLLRLLDAYRAARGEGVASPLHLVGRPGPGGAEIIARAVELGDAVRVHTAATDAELQALYAGARALLMPSLHEGFGLPVVEAMQCGVPVLASGGTALAEIAGGAALLVEPHDTDAIRCGIVELERSRALRTDLAARGIARAAAFTPETQARALHAALATLL